MGESRLEPYAGLLADEANVKAVELTEDVGDHARRVLSVVPAALGPRLGPRTQEVIRAVKEGRWEERDEGTVVAGGVELEPGEYTLALRPAHAGARVLAGETGVVVIDLDLDDQLLAEGLVRDLVRIVQQTRKQANLHVTDRIRLLVGLEPGPLERLRAWEGPVGADGGGAWERELCGQTLASSLEVVEDPAALLRRPPEVAEHHRHHLPADPGPTGEANGAEQAHTASFDLPEAGTVVVEVVRLEPVGR